MSPGPASDLVQDGDDLPAVAQRIAERACAHLPGHGHAIAVTGTPRQGLVVRTAGLPPRLAQAVTDALTTGGPLPAGAHVVELESSRGHHGRLVAVEVRGARGRGPAADRRRRDTLRGCAADAAAALDMVVALQASRREASRSQALLELSHELARTEEVGQVAAALATALPGIVGCLRSGVLLWDTATAELRAAAARGLEADQQTALMATVLKPSTTPEVADLLASREPVLIDAHSASPTLAALLGRTGSSSVLAVPLLVAGEVAGVVTASWGMHAAPGDPHETLELASGVADQAATALARAHLVSTVRHQSLHDALTGLPNRVLFGRRLDRALLACAPGEAVGLLFCDLDRFKPVNDLLGHAAGDELLRQVARRLRGAVREVDTVGRLSGDEFAVLLPHLTDPDAADRVARRVVAGFEAPFRLEGRVVRMTTSVGLATHEGPHGRADLLLRAADGAMYRAKQRGRHQIARAEAPGPAVPDARLSQEVDLTTRGGDAVTSLPAGRGHPAATRRGGAAAR